MFFSLSEEDEKIDAGVPQKEISKKQLLALCKSNSSAQVAYYAFNKFNSIINRRVKSYVAENRVCTYNKDH